jgi:adenylate cyclase
MDERVKARLRVFAVLACAGAVAGVAYMPFIADAVTLATALAFAAQGVLIALLVFGFEFFASEEYLNRRLRRAPFAVVFLTKTLITTALIVAAYGIGGLLLFPERFDQDVLIIDLVRDTAFALAVAAVLQFFLMIQSIIGGRVLSNIVLGRYHRPLNEERIFMFLDVSGSTALAESLGGVGAYSMISRFFFDVAQETMRYGGETHEYIGDEVVVTWPLGGARENARCVDAYFAICDRIAAKGQAYQWDFGAVPQFRVGLHGGPIVAGECGDDKYEIVYFGDTINTAARIEEACKEFKQSLLVSADLLQRMDLGPGYGATSLGKVKLRGREREIELCTIARRQPMDQPYAASVSSSAASSPSVTGLIGGRIR